MSELNFAERVAVLLDVPVNVAEALTVATLRTLAQRISGGQARDLAQQVPDELRPLFAKAREEAEAFPFEDFVERVAEATELDYPTATRGVAAVLQVLRDVVGPKEFMDAMAQLPKEFRELATSQH